MVQNVIDTNGRREFGELKATLVDALECASRIAIEKGGAPAVLLHEFLAALRADQLKLPVLSESASRVMQWIGEPDVDLGELVRLVEIDPALAIKTVGVANSTYYRGAERATSVHDALMRIGLDQARNVVLAVALQSSLFKVPGFERNAQEVWLHSLFSGFATQALFAEVPPSRGSGFLLGLSHDVGRIVILSFAADVRRRDPKAPHVQIDVVDAVSDLLHAELGALALDSWKFSAAFGRVIANHHHPEAVEDEYAMLGRALCAGDALAHRIESDWNEDEGVLTHDLIERLESVGVPPDHALELIREIHTDFEALAKIV